MCICLFSLVRTTLDTQTYTHSHTDPRTAHWPLMQTPWPTGALCIGYFVMCWVGPSLMEKWKPFELRPILIVYVFPGLANCSGGNWVLSVLLNISSSSVHVLVHGHTHCFVYYPRSSSSPPRHFTTPMSVTQWCTHQMNTLPEWVLQYSLEWLCPITLHIVVRGQKYYIIR